MSATAPVARTFRPPSVWRGIFAVLRHQLRLLLYAPLSYLFMVGFLVALAACVFLIADFYASDEASLRLMLVFLPWVAMVFVPCLAMGLWQGEATDRSAELAATLPLGAGKQVMGKFLAGVVVLLLTLLFTLPLLATVFYLGTPDPWVVFAGYFAAALMLATYFAVALFAAALVGDAVGAFVLGLAALFLLQLLGWDAFARIMGEALPRTAVELVALYSPGTWLREMGSGWIAWSGLAYAVLVTACALWSAAVVVERHRRGTRTLRQRGLGVLRGAAVLAALVVAIAAATLIPGGIDLTAEREFTLHQGSQAVLADLPEGTEVTLYWSASESSVPNAIKAHARRARDLLGTMAARTRGRMTVLEIDPQPDSDQEVEALTHGLRRVPMSSGDSFFLGLTVRHGERRGSLAYLDLRRERLLEYDLAVALQGLTRSRLPRIGVISPLLPPSIAARRPEGLSFMEELKRAYDIAVIPHFSETLPPDLDALLLIDATILRSELLFAVDQFVMGGGGVIAMLDPFLRFKPASNAVNPSPSDEINDLSDLLLRYGLRYQGEAIVGDGSLASPVADQQQARLSFPYWLRLRDEQLAEAHATTADLNEVFLVEPGHFALEDSDRAVALVTTTADSGLRDRTGYGEQTPQVLARSFQADNTPRVLAAALRGPFASAYDNAPEGSQDVLERSTGNPVVLAVADVDWLFDPFSLQSSVLGDQTVTRPLNDNLAFLLNLVEFASGDPGLIAIRSRGRLQRPFTRVARMFKDAEARYRDREVEFADKAAGLESRIAEILELSGARSVDDLPSALRDELKAHYDDLVTVRRAIGTVRHQIRRDIDALGRKVALLNLLAGPVLVVMFAILVAWRRRRRARRNTV